MLFTNLLCSSGTLEDVLHQLCGEEIGEIDFLILQKVKKDDGSLNSIAVAADAHKTLATYTALFAAADETKMQKTPLLNGQQTEGGEIRQYGSGAEVNRGIPIVKGATHTTLSGTFIRRKSIEISSLKAYNGIENLGVIIVNVDGEMWALTDDLTTPTLVKPIPVFSFFVGDKMIGDYDNVDRHPIQWSFRQKWDNMLYGFKPDFDPGNDLP